MRRAVYAPLAYLYWLIVSGKTKPHALTIAISSRLPMTINILAVIWCPLWHLTPPNPQFSNTPMFSVSSYISSLHHQKDDTFYILHTIAPSFRKSSVILSRHAFHPIRYDGTVPGCGYLPHTSIGPGSSCNGHVSCLPSSLYQLHLFLVSLHSYPKKGQSLQFSGRSIINTAFFILHL